MDKMNESDEPKFNFTCRKKVSIGNIQYNLTSGICAVSFLVTVPNVSELACKLDSMIFARIKTPKL